MRLVPLVLVCLFVAGCSDPAPNELATPAQPTESAPGASQIDVPEWAIGDWWTFRVKTPAGSFETTRIVTANDTAYQIGTDNPDTAWDHYLDPISILGEVSKDHLDGSQTDGPVKFFDFPLEEGKTWAMTWDGRSLDATVTSVRDGTATMDYYQDENRSRQVVYDVHDRWLERMSASVNGDELFSMELVDSGTDWDGDVVDWIVYGRIERELSSGYGRTLIDVPEAAKEVWYRTSATCHADSPVGSFRFALYTGDTEPLPIVEHQANCPAEVDEEGYVTAAAGAWSAQIQALAVDGAYVVAARTLVSTTLEGDNDQESA